MEWPLQHYDDYYCFGLKDEEVILIMVFEMMMTMVQRNMAFDDDELDTFEEE